MSRILREKDKIYDNLTKKARWFQQNSEFLTHKDYFHVITVLQKYRLCLKYIQNSLTNKKNYLYVQTKYSWLTLHTH